MFALAWDCFLLRPRGFPAHHRGPGELLAKYFVDFSGQRALDLLTQYRLPPGHIVRIGRAGEIQTVFENLIRDGLKGTGHAGPLCTSLLEYLIILIADSIIPTETRQSPAFTTYQRCREHIVTNFQRLTSLEQIAHECHIDQAYLCRLFRRHDHQTPYRYLLRLKMNRAAERLLNPAVLVKQVAVETGFDDPFHFSRAFRTSSVCRRRLFAVCAEQLRGCRIDRTLGARPCAVRTAKVPLFTAYASSSCDQSASTGMQVHFGRNPVSTTALCQFTVGLDE